MALFPATVVAKSSVRYAGTGVLTRSGTASITETDVF